MPCHVWACMLTYMYTLCIVFGMVYTASALLFPCFTEHLLALSQVYQAPACPFPLLTKHLLGCCPGLPSTCLAFSQVYSAPDGFSQACQASAWLLPQVYQAPAWLRPRFTKHLQAFSRFTKHLLCFFSGLLSICCLFVGFTINLLCLQYSPCQVR